MQADGKGKFTRTAEEMPPDSDREHGLIPDVIMMIKIWDTDTLESYIIAQQLVGPDLVPGEMVWVL